jgi:hypothetical protein
MEEDLLARLRAGNGLSLEEIAALAPSDLPAVRELARSSETGPRRSALTVLVTKKAPDCDEIYLQAVRDAERDLPFIALEGLTACLEPHHQADLFAAYDARPEGHIRAEIARTIGRLESRGDFRSLRKRAEQETDESAKEGVRDALARMGDGPSREEIARGLPTLREHRKRLFLQQGLEYLKAPWILKALLPLLDDEEVHLDMRSVWHGLPGQGIPAEFCQSERICDRAAAWVAEISGHRFSFTAERMVHLTPAQLEEVRAFLRTG